jgi:hypothetical protein
LRAVGDLIAMMAARRNLLNPPAADAVAGVF